MEVEWKIAPFLPSIVPDCHTLRMRLMTVEDINCHRFAWLPWHGGSDWKAAGCLVGGLALHPNRYPSIFTTIHIVSKNGFLWMSTIDQPQNGRVRLPGTNHNLTFTCVPNPLRISAFLDTWGRGALPTQSRPTEQPESVYSTNTLGCLWRQDTLQDSCVISLWLTRRWIKSFHWAQRGPFVCSGTITNYDSSEQHHGKWYGPWVTSSPHTALPILHLLINPAVMQKINVPPTTRESLWQ